MHCVMAVSLLNGYLTLVSTADYTNAALKRRLWQVITFDSYLKVPNSNLDLVLLRTYCGMASLNRPFISSIQTFLNVAHKYVYLYDLCNLRSFKSN